MRLSFIKITVKSVGRGEKRGESRKPQRKRDDPKLIFMWAILVSLSFLNLSFPLMCDFSFSYLCDLNYIAYDIAPISCVNITF